jgi:hypothetical protein
MRDKLKILIIARYYPPYASIASLRPYSWSKYWALEGHEIHVLTYPEESGGNSNSLVVPENVTVHRPVNVFVEFIKQRMGIKVNDEPQNSSVSNSGLLQAVARKCINFLSRRLHDSRIPNIHDLWYFSAIKAVRYEQWDVVISTFAPPVTHLVARTLKKRGLTRYWCADFRDLWIDHSIAHGMFPFTYIEKYLERSVCLTADMVTVVSRPLADTLIGKYGKISVEVVSNGFDSDDLETLPKEKYFDPSQITLLYTGTLYKGKRDPEPLFVAVKSLLNEAEFQTAMKRLRIVIAGSSFFSLVKLISSYGLDGNVDFVGQVDRKTALHMQRDADILLFLENDNDCRNGVMTGKIFEYLFSGTKIWGIGVSDDSSPGRLIVDSGAGCNFGTDVDAIVSSLKDLIRDDIRHPVFKQSCLPDTYSRKRLASNMLEMIRQELVFE